MSGIEAAGIALAVFPILVDGLNRFVAGIQTIKRWKRYRLKLRKYADILESAEVYFLDTLDELLGDIVHSDRELEHLLEEPGGQQWKKPEYEERLRERLHRSYKSYLRTVQSLGHALRDMCEKLGVDNAGRVKWDDYSIVEREMQRLKMTFSENIYKELLEDIRRANQDLREVTHQSIALEPTKRKRRPRRPIADLKLIRKHAASLYQVLMTDKAWKCKCKNNHMASLRLEARPQTIEEIKADIPQNYSFRILLSIVEKTKIDGSTAQWEEIEIIPSLESYAVARKTPPSSSVLRSDAHRATRAVSFAPENGSHLTGLLDEAAAAGPEPAYVYDICSALYALEGDNREIGSLVDEGVEKHYHRLYRADTARKPPTSSKSLEEILKTQKHSPDEALSRKDRLRIAVILASSVLQLDGTSWLKSEWTSDDIFFHQKNGRDSEYSYPYLYWQQCCGTDMPCSLEQLCINNQMIRSNILLALGLILVELCFGRTLADMRKPEDVDVNETETRIKTAVRLHRRVYDEMGIPYGDVVRRCIFQPFDVRELSLDIEEVQQKVFDDVVTPLVDDLNNFNGDLRIR